MTICDFRVEKPISLTSVNNLSVWAGVVLHYPLLLSQFLISLSDVTALTLKIIIG